MTGHGGFDGDLLRRNPASFFGLPRGYDAKDLRRAYHAAIRRFRPDTHPREFQLLREAHDLLSGRLAPGGESVAPEEEFESPPPPAPPASRELRTPRQRAEAYRDLSRAPRSPLEFVALAALADTLPAADRNFEAWLVEGLARHPEDDGLESLLRIYQQEDLPVAEVPRFLRRTASALPPRVFWSLTPFSWETAAVSLPFERFRSVWEECGSPEDDIDEEPRAVLLAYLLPLLAPGADPAWLKETVAWVGQRHDMIPDDGAVLDVIEAWIPLRENFEGGRRPLRSEEAAPRRRFLPPPPKPARFPGTPEGRAVEELARALLAAGCRDGGSRLARAAAEVVDRTEDVLEAFRPPNAPLAKAISRLARWAGPLVSNQASFDPSREPKEEARIVYALHRRADKALRWTKERMQLWYLNQFGLKFLDTLATAALGFLILLLAIAGMLLLADASSWNGVSVPKVIGGSLCMLGSVAGAYFLIKQPPRFGTRWHDRMCASAHRNAYERHVRPIVLEAVRELGLPPEALVDPAVIQPGDLNPLVVHGVAEDPALPILRIACRFAP